MPEPQYPQPPRKPPASSSQVRPQGPGPTPGRPSSNLLPVIKGFLDQGPGMTPPSSGPTGPGYTPPTAPGGGAPSRTRPSMYPDVQGFSRTPVGQMLLRNVIQRMMAVKRSGGQAWPLGPTPRGPRTEPYAYTTQGR